MRSTQVLIFIVVLCLETFAIAGPQAMEPPAAIAANTSSSTEPNDQNLDPICDSPSGPGGVKKRPQISDCMGAVRKISRDILIAVSGGGISYTNKECRIGLQLANVGDTDEVSGEDVWWAANQVALSCMISVGSITPGRTAGGMTGLGRNGRVILTMKNPDPREEDGIESDVASS